MISPNAITANDTSTSGTTSSSSSTQNTPDNTLGPDSFITLLTAQLQAQDPLSPMDPDQMVNELTSINTLQQIMQIRTDMDTLVSALPAGQGSTGSNSNAVSSIAHATNFAPPAAAKLNYQLNHQVNPQMSANSDSY
ncbi:MAG: flagellar hook capping FlgD N-terminal domain-containing protein [Candidatus Acidiferrum sp.]